MSIDSSSSNHYYINTMKYYIDGKEVSALEKLQHKLKQLNEASNLLEEFSDRLCWADDFANYDSIRDALDPVFTATEHAKDEIEEEILELESQVEELKERKLGAEAEIEQEFEQSIRYALV